MAVACLSPSSIRRLHLTGVPAERDTFAQHVLASWRSVLSSASSDGDVLTANKDNDSASTVAKRDRLRAFAWLCFFGTHSDAFLASVGTDRLTSWVERVCEGNTVEGLMALLEQTHTEDVDDEWHTVSMAGRMANGACQSIQGRMVVGDRDQMASVEEVQRLGRMLGWITEDGLENLGVFEGAGHAIVIEQPRKWREDLLSFLNE